MKTSLLLKKLHLDKKEFITSAILKKYCKKLELDYENTIRYFMRQGYLIRIFKGIFYVKDLEEIKLGTLNYSYRELIAKGLDLKDVKKWYFGLHSALKLNNMTHETFVIDHVINDTIFRAKPIDIAGYKIKFHRISSKILTFGIITKDTIRFSDPEKTLLDFLYILRYNGVPENKIIMDLSEYAHIISKEKIRTYSKHYPQSVQKTLEGLL
jgi:predicted transcriptional regulator of viral defense system